MSLVLWENPETEKEVVTMTKNWNGTLGKPHSFDEVPGRLAMAIIRAHLVTGIDWSKVCRFCGEKKSKHKRGSR
jgi:hypothetical protein